MEKLEEYINGNVNVAIYDNGTRVCYNDLDYFDFEFPLSIDCKITNRCKIGCSFCHENSTKDGKHGDIMDAKFVDTLHAGTELAIGGGSITEHPDLYQFLQKLKERKVIANITVSQREYQEKFDFISQLITEDLVHGIGISFSSFNDVFWNKVLTNNNVVVHLIAGVHGKDVFDYLINKNAKILVLGYKDFGRGHNLLEKASAIIEIQKEWLKNALPYYFGQANLLSFDNLALKQLEVEKHFTTEEWEKLYQGDDGTCSMYIDLVNKKFAKNSTSTIRYDLLDNIKDMFEVVKNENKGKNQK